MRRKQTPVPEAGSCTAPRPWFEGETPLALADVPKHWPPKAGSKLVHVTTVRRWARDGVYGVRLRLFSAGPRTLATTLEEIRRFMAELNRLTGRA